MNGYTNSLYSIAAHKDLKVAFSRSCVMPMGLYRPFSGLFCLFHLGELLAVRQNRFFFVS